MTQQFSRPNISHFNNQYDDVKKGFYNGIFAMFFRSLEMSTWVIILQILIGCRYLKNTTSIKKIKLVLNCAGDFSKTAKTGKS